MSIDVDRNALAELSSLLRVLADENRLRILKVLTQQEICVCDIMAELDLPQPLASHHLGVLKRAGLVRDRQDAQWVYYSIDSEQLAALNERYLALLDVAHLPPEAAYGAGTRKCVRDSSEQSVPTLSGKELAPFALGTERRSGQDQ